MAIHWHRKDSQNQDFTKQADVLWKAKVSLRTALAYNATRAQIAALANKSPADRSSVQHELAKLILKPVERREILAFKEMAIAMNKSTH